MIARMKKTKQKFTAKQNQYYYNAPWHNGAVCL